MHDCGRPANLQVAAQLHLLVDGVVVQFVYLLVAVLEELEADTLGFQDAFGGHELLLPVEYLFVLLTLFACYIVFNGFYYVLVRLVHLLLILLPRGLGNHIKALPQRVVVWHR